MKRLLLTLSLAAFAHAGTANWTYTYNNPTCVAVKTSCIQKFQVGIVNMAVTPATFTPIADIPIPASPAPTGTVVYSQVPFMGASPILGSGITMAIVVITLDYNGNPMPPVLTPADQTATTLTISANTPNGVIIQLVNGQ